MIYHCQLPGQFVVLPQLGPLRSACFALAVGAWESPCPPFSTRLCRHRSPLALPAAPCCRDARG
eukprot:14799745-Alexandrium_andersonii.AAC.1